MINIGVKTEMDNKGEREVVRNNKTRPGIISSEWSRNRDRQLARYRNRCKAKLESERHEGRHKRRRDSLCIHSGENFQRLTLEGPDGESGRTGGGIARGGRGRQPLENCNEINNDDD
ncbi:hypothetical protein EVAR_60815_1 [Eumeta japonica]|uniref:Uncharacterized protein n=1 Tax=Eumeta variegata TaxID=151549 RepID=A0A4C1YJA4_EUMVA|nr:hypothetical protein EVAR_60815_1 [Eumeta japonica]